MDAPKRKYHMLSDINEQPFPLNLLAEIGLSDKFPDAKKCTADIRKGLAAALSTLDEKEELAILLRYRHGYKLDEIAEQLNATKEWARITIKNALDKLNQPFARSLIERGIMGYIEHQAEEKADKIVRERLSKEYLRGYETGRHDATIAKESSVVFDFSDFDLSSFNTAAEFSVVGIESMRDLLYPVALSSIHDALREQARHCYLSREAYHEVIEWLNESGFEIQPQDDIEPDIAYLPEFFSCPTVENDEDDNSAVDKEHQLALNYASWVLPQYIRDMPLEVLHHDDDSKFIIEFGNCAILPNQKYIDQYTIDSQEVICFGRTYPYNLINAVFGKSEGVMRVFPEAEQYLMEIIEETLMSLLPVEGKTLKLIYQCNFTAKDIIRFADLPTNDVSDWWLTERLERIRQKAIRKLRHPRYAQKYRVFYSENLQKIYEYISENSEVIPVFNSPTPVKIITKCTDFCDRILKQNPTYTLNQIRNAYLQGRAVAYNGQDFHQRMWELFPGDNVSFYLLNDTISDQRSWFRCDSLGIYSSALKSTVPEFSNLEVERAFFGTGMLKNAYENSLFDEREICCQLDRIFLIETSSHEKRLYWWPRSMVEMYGAENISLVPYTPNTSVIESLYCAVIHNISQPKSESKRSEADRVLCEHFDRIPNSLVFDTIMRTRIWCRWPSHLIVGSIMGLHPDDSVLKAYFGVGIGNYGETLLSASAHSCIENALFIQTTSGVQMLFWVLSDGSVYKFDISDEFLNKLLRAIEGGCHLSETERATIQTTLNKLEYAFCNFYLNNQLPDNEVSSLKEFQHNLIYSMPIEVLDFTVRTYNCLKRADLDTVEKLCKKSKEDLMCVRIMGKKSLDEIEKKLQQYGLTLRKTRTLAEVQAKLAELGSQLQDGSSDT